MPIGHFVYIIQISYGAGFQNAFPKLTPTKFEVEPYLMEFASKTDKILTIPKPIKYKQQCSILKDDIITRERQLARARNREFDLTERIKQLKIENNTLKIEITELNKKNYTDLEQQLYDKDNDYKKLTIELETTRAKLQEDQSKIIELEKTLTETRESINSKDQIIEKLHAEIDRLNTQILHNTSEYCSKINKSTIEMKEKFNKYKDEKIAEITLLKSKIEKLDETLAELEVTRAKLQELEMRQSKLDNLLSTADVADLVIEF
jgi:chromosome segregation ATPase